MHRPQPSSCHTGTRKSAFSSEKALLLFLHDSIADEFVSYIEGGALAGSGGLVTMWAQSPLRVTLQAGGSCLARRTLV